MLPEERDAACLWDMLRYGHHCADVLAARSNDDWEHDLTVRLAVERCLEIIGEAARRISPQFQAAHPEIPWRAIIGQRNILAPDYGQIDYVRLFKTVTQDLPPLIRQLETVLALLDSGNPV